MNSWDETIGQTIDLIQDGKDIFSNQYCYFGIDFLLPSFTSNVYSSVLVGCYSILS